MVCDPINKVLDEKVSFFVEGLVRCFCILQPISWPPSAQSLMWNETSVENIPEEKHLFQDSSFEEPGNKRFKNPLFPQLEEIEVFFLSFDACMRDALNKTTSSDSGSLLENKETDGPFFHEMAQLIHHLTQAVTHSIDDPFFLVPFILDDSESLDKYSFRDFNEEKYVNKIPWLRYQIGLLPHQQSTKYMAYYPKEFGYYACWSQPSVERATMMCFLLFEKGDPDNLTLPLCLERIKPLCDKATLLINEDPSDVGRLIYYSFIYESQNILQKIIHTIPRAFCGSADVRCRPKG